MKRGQSISQLLIANPDKTENARNMRPTVWFLLGLWFGWLARGEIATAFLRGIAQ
jgi:hypothetical protein